MCYNLCQDLYTGVRVLLAILFIYSASTNVFVVAVVFIEKYTYLQIMYNFLVYRFLRCDVELIRYYRTSGWNLYAYFTTVTYLSYCEITNFLLLSPTSLTSYLPPQILDDKSLRLILIFVPMFIGAHWNLVHALSPWPRPWTFNLFVANYLDTNNKKKPCRSALMIKLLGV